MDIKFTYLIAAVDKNRSVTDPKYLNILLDENGNMPSLQIKGFVGLQDEESVLKSIHDKYMNYHFDYVMKNVCGFRKIAQNVGELIYICSVIYYPGINKTGDFYTIQDIQDQNILLEEYYAEFFFRLGSSSFR